MFSCLCLLSSSLFLSLRSSSLSYLFLFRFYVQWSLNYAYRLHLCYSHCIDFCHGFLSRLRYHYYGQRILGFLRFVFSQCLSQFFRTWWLGGEESMKPVNRNGAFCCLSCWFRKLYSLLFLICIILRFILDVPRDQGSVELSLVMLLLHACQVRGNLLSFRLGHVVALCHLSCFMCLVCRSHYMSWHLFSEYHVRALLLCAVRWGGCTILCVTAWNRGGQLVCLWTFYIQPRWKWCR